MGLFKCRFSGYSVAFSPYTETRIAVGSAQYFGIVGNGAIQVLDLGEPYLMETFGRLTQDNIFDICWNEGHENQLIAGSGDKTVKLFDCNFQQPLLSLEGHTGEVFGVHSNYQATQLVLSASYDTTLKVWDLVQGLCIKNLVEHKAIVYAGIWHPKE
jgi:peroxin-7